MSVLVIDNNKSTKTYIGGMRQMARKKRMQFIPYDYEAAYNKSLEEMHEWFIENLFQHRKKVVYALKEITA